MPFYFLGKGPFSKSLLQRALIAKSYFPYLQIIGDNQCNDVLSLKEGLKNLKNQTVINCLNGGAVLRFLALRVSREKGEFVLTGSPRLFKRPLKELQTVLSQLDCETKVDGNSLKIKSKGWQVLGDAVTVSASRSSQFASALFLNSWNLKHDLFISIEGDRVSFSYLQMTLSFLRSLGMQIKGEEKEYFIPAGQKITQNIYRVEPDMGALFALAGMTNAGGEVVFTDWPEKSLQPDFVFPSLLEDMGFKIKHRHNTLKIKSPKKQLNPIKRNLKNNPDLFPVLSALCAVAGGESSLYGAPQLLYKESHRIKQTAQMLQSAGRNVTVLKDGLIIKGRTGFSAKKKYLFDPKEDHRMAMAGAVLQKAGWPIKILHLEVVNKSFPNFWSIVNSSCSGKTNSC